MGTMVETEDTALAYEKIHLSDFSLYDGDDNDGYQYGLHYGEYCLEDNLFYDDREVQWCKTEQEREEFIAKELAEYTSIHEL